MIIWGWIKDREIQIFVENHPVVLKKGFILNCERDLNQTFEYYSNAQSMFEHSIHVAFVLTFFNRLTLVI